MEVFYPASFLQLKDLLLRGEIRLRNMIKGDWIGNSSLPNLLLFYTNPNDIKLQDDTFLVKVYIPDEKLSRLTSNIYSYNRPYYLNLRTDKVIFRSIEQQETLLEKYQDEDKYKYLYLLKRFSCFEYKEFYCLEEEYDIEVNKTSEDNSKQYLFEDEVYNSIRGCLYRYAYDLKDLNNIVFTQKLDTFTPTLLSVASNRVNFSGKDPMSFLILAYICSFKPSEKIDYFKQFYEMASVLSWSKSYINDFTSPNVNDIVSKSIKSFKLLIDGIPPTGYLKSQVLYNIYEGALRGFIAFPREYIKAFSNEQLLKVLDIDSKIYQNLHFPTRAVRRSR